MQPATSQGVRRFGVALGVTLCIEAILIVLLDPLLRRIGHVASIFVTSTISTCCTCLAIIYMNWPVWLKRVRKEQGQCLHCGYDLRASPGRCPECGEPAPGTRAGA